MTTPPHVISPWADVPTRPEDEFTAEDLFAFNGEVTPDLPLGVYADDLTPD